MNIYVEDNKIWLTGINAQIANMIPGVTYDKHLRAYHAPVTVAPTLVNTIPTKCSADIRRLAAEVKAAESVITDLKTNGYDGEHAFLMNHQALCLEIAKVTPSYGFFLETGTGKTALGLSIIDANPHIKWLVVCPQTIIKPAWLEDAAKFYPDMKIMKYKRGMLVREMDEYRAKWNTKNPVEVAQVYVCNYESFRVMADEFLELGVKGVIFDESVKIKNPQTSVTKVALEFVGYMDYKYLLTGIPAPNNELEYFTQLQVVDPAVFGTNYWRFRNTYFEAHDFYQRKWVMRREMNDRFIDKLASRSIVIRKKDCLDLPEMVSEKRLITLSSRAMAYYNDMHKKRVLQILQEQQEKGTTVIAQNKLVQVMKLRQITSGFIIDNDENTKMLHNDKMTALIDVLEELGGAQAIIWCNFKNEIRKIKELLGDKAVTAYSETEDTDQSIKDFQTGKALYMIAHPQTLKYGVTLTNCTYAIYYSLSYSYDDFAQSKDRIHRYGQDSKTTLIFLTAENTIDEVLYDVVHQKMSNDDMIKELLSMGVRLSA